MQVIIKFALVNELGMVRVDGLDFDGDFEVGLGVDGLINLSESPFVNLSDDLEVLSHFLKHLRHSGSLSYNN